MKNAASSENREMRDAMAYKGTMTMIRTTILNEMTGDCEHQTRANARPRLEGSEPLQMWLPVISEMQKY